MQMSLARVGVFYSHFSAKETNNIYQENDNHLDQATEKPGVRIDALIKSQS
jgi:hypothetical protein